jgi:phosphopantetheine adenylyltransferase
MISFMMIIISTQIFTDAMIEMPILFAQMPIESVNVHGVIIDSLSYEPIPSARVTIENLGKSFKTTRSSFYLRLPSETYIFFLEADGYENLRKSIPVSSQNSDISLEMVKLSDRAAIKARQDTIELYLSSFDNLLKNRAFSEAYDLIVLIERHSVSSSIIDSLGVLYEATKSHWIDTLLQNARTFEDSSKYTEAAYFYQQVIDLDSLNTLAQEKVEEMKTKLTRETVTVKTPTKTASELEKMYNEAVAKFLAEDYTVAYNLFKTFLIYKPRHEGARDYFERTKARLKALE